VATATEQLVESTARGRLVRRFALTIVEGEGAGTVWRSTGQSCAIGSSDRNEMVLADGAVSRFHCEIELGPAQARVRDLQSRNGTVVDGVQIYDAALRTGSLIRLGRTTLRFDLLAERQLRKLTTRTSFGSLVGTSAAMRETFALLERAVQSDVTVLLEGETGTGKGAAAEALHAGGTRAALPFIVVDCAALPATLLESELFGHEKGAFTGASARRIGAFETCAGGTLFLDEIGELPAELQPKLLRVLEHRQIRRVGRTSYQPVDFRLVAASNRDLRAEVNSGRFRADLYFRLAVMKIPMPALRQRPEDLPAIARQILTTMGAAPEVIDQLLGADLVVALQAAAWPGNVRELRNHLERSLVLGEPSPVGEPPADEGAAIDELPYADARRAAIAAFERSYLERLLSTHDGNVMAAARAAGLAREYVHRLIARHGLRR
jgi:DNA-binding NtrC family response regulator